MKNIKLQLQLGQPSIGSWMQLPDPSVAEIMGQAGFDWIAVDLEHGLFGIDALPDVCRAIELGGTVPFARIAQNACKDIKQALEAGVRGIIVPMIESRAEMEQAIGWALYPPIGRRGVGYSRANLFGQRFAGYFEKINEELVIVAQIESISAIRRLDEILSVPGIDAMIIGPYDLSASMGLTGQFDHSDFQAALTSATQTARERKIPMGLHIVQPDPELLQQKIAENYRFIAYGIDAVFLQRYAKNPLSSKG